MKRLVAVGDIHGQRKLLADLINQIQPETEDQLVFLGDYIDRGPDSPGVIEDLLDIQSIFPQTVFLRGNHEQLFLDSLISCGVLQGKRLEEISATWGREMIRDTDVACFKRNGGEETLKSYGVEMVRDSSHDDNVLWPKYSMLGEIPQEHLGFFQATQLYYQHDNFTFVHAGYQTRYTNKDIAQQASDDPWILLWERYGGKETDGETIVVGHTPVPDKPCFEAGRINVDTGAAYGKPLSAVDVLTNHVFQACP